MVNMFALISTDPRALYSALDPVGPRNDAAILDAASKGDIICAWGNHGSLHGRDRQVLRLLDAAGLPALALKISKTGQPSHPLYLPYELLPVPFAP